MRFSAYLYVMPFMFVYSPILMPNGFTSDVLYCWVIMFISAIPFGAGMMGYLFGHLNVVQRGLLLLSAVLFIYPSGIADIVATVLSLVVAIPQYLNWRKAKQAVGSTPA